MMLRGPGRYQYVESTADYHQIANPLIAPIKGTRMRLPRSLQVSREKAVQCGPLLRHLHPVVPDNGWHNTVAAFRKRCNYFNAGRATPKIIHAAQELTKIVCPKPMLPFEWTDSLYKAWLAKFGTEKQARMNRAINDLCNVTLQDYTNKDIFVKVEALLVTHKPNWAPRVIFKGTDVYNAISGPIFNELMRRLDHCFERMKGPYRYHTSYRKTPSDYTHHLERQNDNDFWIEADFSSNDKFQCSDVQLLEVALMRVMGCPEWFVRLHLRTNTFKVFNSKHGITAKLENQLPTGATDTTYRNTFWNAVICHAAMRELKPDKMVAMLLGDDMLCRVTGKCRYVEKIYTSVASEALMEAKVKRHSQLWTATFLSKFFVPAQGQHLTVPILGKALGRFNMRANRNQAVSDHEYMAGKSLGYAYEFRHCPMIRNIFLERFKYEFAFVAEERYKLVDIEAGLTWNAKAAGVTLANVTTKLLVPVEYQLTEYDFTAFCIERYNLMGMEVLELFTEVVCNTSKIDLEGTSVMKLAKDFL
ncbi:RNA-dependent RNA polymerase [Erysiphe necator associated virus 4]|nr:RNA-dependent RNA polymerase [Erysiphe necator associated virus 4]